MHSAFEGFLTRQGFCQSLGCGAFDFDPRHDLHVAAGDNDPGLYVRGHELLRPFQTTHRRAVVVLDAEWDGSPGADAIRDNLTQKILTTGWDGDAFQVIVIEPELENWIWQQNDHVAQGLGFDNRHHLMADPHIQAAWPAGQIKPTDPKTIMEALLRKQRIPRSSAIYKQITSRISVRHCQDTAFQLLVQRFRVWFPPENG